MRDLQSTDCEVEARITNLNHHTGWSSFKNFSIPLTCNVEYLRINPSHFRSTTKLR